ncbi:hypothetical protein P7C70_g8241, partial [Phenoliferia sp. Uapishka_3]
MAPRLSLRSPLPYILAAIILIILISTQSTSDDTISPTSSTTDQNPNLLASPPSPLSQLPSWSSYPYSPSTSDLSYRNHLELTTSPNAQITHSPTLGFSNIYVLSLPHRLDRRDDMGKLARALGLNITFVDAANKDDNFFGWIAERVAETRAVRAALMVSPSSSPSSLYMVLLHLRRTRSRAKSERMASVERHRALRTVPRCIFTNLSLYHSCYPLLQAKTRGVPVSKIGGLGIGSVWVTPYQDTGSAHTPFPPFPADSRYPSGNWTSHLELAHSTGTLDSLIPSNPEVNVTEILWDKREWLPLRQMSEGVLSTFWGHTRVLKKIVESGDESALVLEDDVDVEWDLERLWSRMRGKLPKGWETVHLGHCWGHELLNPQYLHPLLHKATAPKCLHGWAVSRSGALHLLSLLNNPWSAYSTAVDVAVPTFISSHLLRSFSVEPPLIIQRKDGPSDLQGGNGSKWRGLLRDSTFDRIWKDEGEVIGEDVYDTKHLDPATTFREGKAASC